jgi:DNA-binding transcriptional LysR family regulator
MLSYSAESGIGRILRDVHGQRLDRWPAQSVVKAHLASVLRTMALDGRGMAWLPRTLIVEDLAAGRLVDAAPPEWRVEMEVRLYRDRSPLGKAAEELWGSVGEAAVRRA